MRRPRGRSIFLRLGPEVRRLAVQFNLERLKKYGNKGHRQSGWRKEDASYADGLR